VQDRVKPSFITFDIWMSKVTNDGLTRSGWHRMLYSCTHMATVGVKGLKYEEWEPPGVDVNERHRFYCSVGGEWQDQWLSSGSHRSELTGIRLTNISANTETTYILTKWVVIKYKSCQRSKNRNTKKNTATRVIKYRWENRNTCHQIYWRQKWKKTALMGNTQREIP